MIFLIFFDSILSIRLKKMNVSETRIGFIFGIGCLTYTVSSPIVGFICKFCEKRLITWFAFVIATIGLFLFGPSSFLKFPDKLELLLAGIGLIGISASFIVVPLLSEITEAVKADAKV